jgi:hypothetical protein
VDPSTLDLVTLLVAVLGVVTGAASLAWQWYSFRRSGPDVTVRISWGLAPASLVEDEMVLVLIVEANNAGRQRIQITSWGIRLPGKLGSIQTLYPSFGSSPIPTVLEPGHSASWVMQTARLDRRLHELSASRSLKLRGWVSLGSGKKVASHPLKVAKEGLNADGLARPPGH